MSLDTGLPVERLESVVVNALADDPQVGETVVPAITRRGHAFECWVRPAIAHAGRRELRGDPAHG
jgi:hypothetical protein